MIPVPIFKDRTVAVFGLARTGLSAVRALAAGGARVLVGDDSAVRREAAAEAGFAVVDLATADWKDIAALVLSPGVPLTHPKPHRVVERARAAGVEVIGDIELFARSGLAARRVGITGTNGKSTTTALIGHLLQAAGRPVAVGGNLGTAVLDLPVLGADGTYVVEMSSYQIDLTPSLGCDVAILLNITPDHIDRHGSFEGYAAVKERIFDGVPAAGQTAVVGIDDEACEAILDRLRAAGDRTGTRTLVPVAVGRRVAGAVSVVDGMLYDEAGAALLDLTGCKTLPGAHNWQNAAAAFAAARALGLSLAEIADGLKSFPGLAHRMEHVAEIAGIRFVNDSKATNAEAAARALVCYDTIYWIAGGRAKAGGIDPLKPFFPRIRHAFLIGEAQQSFAASLDGAVPASLSETLPAAVAAAFAQARADGRPGAVVLFSPACASFDQFSDFEARGEAFRALVAELAPGDPVTCRGVA